MDVLSGWGTLTSTDPGATLHPLHAWTILPYPEIAENVVHEVAALVAQGTVSIILPRPYGSPTRLYHLCIHSDADPSMPIPHAHQEDVRVPRNICAEKEAVSTVQHGRATVDVFGVSTTSLPIDHVSCPNCARRVAASRFAPHLDKCMGRGRVATGRATAGF